jgi:hypothetical protein
MCSAVSNLAGIVCGAGIKTLKRVIEMLHVAKSTPFWNQTKRESGFFATSKESVLNFDLFTDAGIKASNSHSEWKVNCIMTRGTPDL